MKGLVQEFMRRLSKSGGRGVAILGVVLGIGFQPAAGAETPEEKDAFLDRPFPQKQILDEEGLARTHSLAEGAQLLGLLVGKKVVLPEGFAEGTVKWWKEEGGMAVGAVDRQTVRELFKTACIVMGVTWRYDIERDEILLIPRWKRSDSRPARELAEVLLASRPVPPWPLREGARKGGDGVSVGPDDWLVAFDALLSKPENYSTAGALRFYCDRRNPLFSRIVMLYTGKMVDESGREVILILNGQAWLDNKAGPGNLVYFVFDSNGRFLYGGEFPTANAVGSIVHVESEGKRNVGVDIEWGSFGEPRQRFHFGLAGENLVLLGARDSEGREMSAKETRKGFHSWCRDMGLPQYYVSASGSAASPGKP